MKHLPFPATTPSFKCKLVPHLAVWPLLRLSAQFRRFPTISDAYPMRLWGSTEPLKHSSGWLKGYFQYPTSYSVKIRAGDSKAAATQPPSRPRPPRCHKTSPLSPLMRWIAARRSGRSEWRPFIVKWGRRLVHHGCLCGVWSFDRWFPGNGRARPKVIFSPGPLSPFFFVGKYPCRCGKYPEYLIGGK
jgi:hypothetical protein